MYGEKVKEINGLVITLSQTHQYCVWGKNGERLAFKLSKEDAENYCSTRTPSDPDEIKDVHGGFTKSELQRIMKWIGSRYNAYTKEQAIDIILKAQFLQRDTEEVFTCGAWTEPAQRSKYSTIKNMGTQYRYVFRKQGSHVSLQLADGNIIEKQIIRK